MEINSLYYYRALSINLVGGTYEYAITPCYCPPPPRALRMWKAEEKQRQSSFTRTGSRLLPDN